MGTLRKGAKGSSPKTQQEMADLMRVPKYVYEKWEQRGNMPPDYIELFCELTRCSTTYYLTGRD